MASLLHEPAELEKGVGALAGTHDCRELTPIAALVESIGQSEQGDQVVCQHHPPLRLHVEAPHKVKQEVAEADDHDDGVELCALLSEVAERPGTQKDGRHETKAGRESTVNGGDDSTVPLGGASSVEEVEEEIEVGPEQEAP